MSDLIDRAVAYVKSTQYLELTTRQLAVLGVAMRYSKPLRVREMADELRVEKPVITRALNTLEAHGFVERRRGSDKRDRFIHVTPAGHEFRAKIGGVA